MCGTADPELCIPEYAGMGSHPQDEGRAFLSVAASEVSMENLAVHDIPSWTFLGQREDVCAL